MTARRTPFQKAKQAIIDQKLLPQEYIALLPRRWKRVGQVGIFELHPHLLEWKEEIGETYLTYLPELRTTTHKVGTTTSFTRKPSYEILAGEKNTVTLHKELGCKFWIDALKLTFSNGNHAERQRMIRVSTDHEQIIDMFACVGNLSLPIAVHHASTKVIGIEINPYAYKFLEKNIQENNLTNQYQAILGDNREKTPQNWANRVIMGYFTIDKSQLTAALASLQHQKGGTIHTHGLEGSQQANEMQGELKTIIQESFPHFKVKSMQTRIIKSVAPGVNHFVKDFEIKTTELR